MQDQFLAELSSSSDALNKCAISRTLYFPGAVFPRTLKSRNSLMYLPYEKCANVRKRMEFRYSIER
ncbi:hypothetical protein AJ88_07830 [Mesorhizobium amorphae CCBAU 01583]|nr:hypothetical protein AJ88_07830 [Mesorhizobium amorphae CCBAU 01583]